MADDIETKSIEGFEIKDADLGEVAAVVSTFNVVDRDGDVVLPGAIADGTVVKLSAYGHDSVLTGAPPVGRGVLRVDGTKAVLNATYFMKSTRAQEAFAVVKGLGADSEWSVGWPPSSVKTAPMTKEWAAKGARRLIKSFKVMEVSPVFLGANQYTSTLGVKSTADDQADGAAAAIDAETLAAAVELVTTKRAEEAAETKRMADAAATKAAEEAEAARLATEAAERARITAIATKEYERFQRTMRRTA
jgi:hypothetical protein